MKITIVQGAFFPVPPLLGGAIEKTWYVLGQAFAAAGHQVTHISRQHSDLPEQETTHGVEYRRVPGHSAVRNPLLLKALDFLYTRRVCHALPAADILVSNTFWLPILARDPRHGAAYVHVARMPKGQMRLYKRAARLQGVSSAVAEAMAAESPAQQKQISVVPLPLPWTVPTTVGAKTRTILYVGRVDPEKGLELLLHAMAKASASLSGWELRVVGPAEPHLGGGGAAYLARLQKLAADLQLKVTWRGPTFDAQDLQRELSAATLFVYPSLAERGETFGLAVLEAMSCGSVPIVSDLACFRDFVEPGKNGAVFDHRAPDAADRLASELCRLAADESACVRMAESARETARSYEVAPLAELYLADFARLLAPSAA